MLKKIMLAACTLVFASSLWAATNPKVLISTTMGDIEVELNAEKAPISVKNFLGYVDSGFYKNTQFHRVIPGFMVQGGGFDADMKQKQTGAPIRNEADNGLHNVRGTLAMARTQVRDSATSQFFINHKDNAFLDNGSRDFGYAVFGKVTQGMNVVDKIAQVPTGNSGGMQNVPREPVMILDVKRL
ncbi:peptidylprolyl isomerase [Pseudomonas sp. NPDC078700]|uniref:peptidylprolyl isomerase n=1 Tax=Pseudomonas sp. NPDC078700 TaxID=3364424 RepID=UPI0037CC4DCA